ncbi:MAG: 30S ribosomal protein S3 [Patescibacteria group bacterium]|nr:30S ribosomal protein S3 [Patescibacteria group bacterium]
MGRRIKPNSYRLGITKPWDVRWITNKRNFAVWLEEDEKIRALIMKKIGQAGVARIEIERTPDRYRIFIKASRPGLIIGRGGKGVEDLTKALEKAIKSKVALNLSVEELKRTEVSATVVAQNIAWDLEKRFKFRRTIKKYLDSLKQNRDVKGAKITVSGRLDGNEIARTETLMSGKLPLSTLRADIDYGEATAFTTYGTIGIKVWINRGEIFAANR